MIFEIADVKPRNPWFALAMDEAICFWLQSQGSTGYQGGIRLWSNPWTIVLGRSCQAEVNVATSDYLIPGPTKGPRLASTARPALARRQSGGGTVLHGPGNINYSLFLSLHAWPELFSVDRSYAMLLELICNALRCQNISCERCGQSDLVSGTDAGQQLKVSGNSQFRKHGVLVLHGTLITHAGIIDKVSQWLQHPPKEPEYRARRDHRQFLTALPAHFEVAHFFECLKKHFCLLAGTPGAERLPESETKRIYSYARKLTRTVYGRADWIKQAKRSSRNALVPALTTVQGALPG
ncbi:MAG: lipoate--protein ligase family protein [Leptospiraceae bacterium]|nr:lipoate--protein ligase family protein [Leptospiraceae bacterium]